MPPHHNTNENDSFSDAAERRPLANISPHPQASEVPAPPECDYQALRASIEACGVLVPLDITAAGVILDGHQRLRAAQELLLPKLPVRIVAPDDELIYMLRVALLRRQLTASQRAALGLELLDYEQRKQQALSRSRRNLSRGPLERATLPAPAGRTRDQVAEYTGTSPRTVQDTATVLEHDPHLFQQVKAGQIPAERAARRIRKQQLRASLDPNPVMPEGPFQLIYADPPWQLGNPDGAYAPENHYPTMAGEQIKQLPLPAAESSALFLWGVNCLLPLALEVIEAWGFEYRSNLCWDKDSIGPGVWLRQQHELLLVATRGGFPPPEPELRFPSVIRAKRRAHSQKPDETYLLLERAYPQASKLELFARSARPGWAVYGNQLAAAQS
jgi:N6-adenosine-specific RNA methylase IME4